MLSRDHTAVPPATHTFIHKWNEHCVPSLPSRRPSPHFGWYSFSVLLRVGGCVGLVAWWNTEVACPPKTVTHPNSNRARRRVTSLIRPTMLPLRHAVSVVTHSKWSRWSLGWENFKFYCKAAGERILKIGAYQSRFWSETSVFTETMYIWLCYWQYMHLNCS